jgi:hypothetical protein
MRDISAERVGLLVAMEVHERLSASGSHLGSSSY